MISYSSISNIKIIELKNNINYNHNNARYSVYWQSPQTTTA